MCQANSQGPQRHLHPAQPGLEGKHTTNIGLIMCHVMGYFGELWGIVGCIDIYIYDICTMDDIMKYMINNTDDCPI